MHVLGMVGAMLGKGEPAAIFPALPHQHNDDEGAQLPSPPPLFPPRSSLSPSACPPALPPRSPCPPRSPPRSACPPSTFLMFLPSVFFAFSRLTFKKRLLLLLRDRFCERLLFLPPWGTRDRKTVFSRHPHIGLSQESRRLLSGSFRHTQTLMGH